MIDRLGLEPHPEGGWFRRTWTSPETVTLPDGRTRPTATLIHYFLASGETSAWHRVASDEIWLSHVGSVELELGGVGDTPRLTAVLRLGGDGDAQVVVPAGTWQRTRPAVDDVLVSCVVSPGYDDADFELHRD